VELGGRADTRDMAETSLHQYLGFCLWPAQGIIAVAKNELPLAEAYLAKAQAILGEAILPEKVDVILAPNEFNQAISRAVAF